MNGVEPGRVDASRCDDPFVRLLVTQKWCVVQTVKRDSRKERAAVAATVTIRYSLPYPSSGEVLI